MSTIATPPNICQYTLSSRLIELFLGHTAVLLVEAVEAGVGEDVGGVCPDVSRFSVPKHGDSVDAKGCLAAIGQGRPASAYKG